MPTGDNVFSPPPTFTAPTAPVATAAPVAATAPSSRVPDGVPVTDVTIIIGYKDRAGRRQEVVHDINDKRILKLSHSSQAKVEKVKVDGQLVDFAATGEVQVKLELIYLDV